MAVADYDAGAKGMISLDSRLHGDVLRIRPSMKKFEGTNITDIEICEAPWKALPAYLNRQVIKIMEDMGTRKEFFLNLQAKAIERLRLITANPINACSFLERQSIGQTTHLPWLINKLSSLNLDFRQDGFLHNALEMAILVELRQLKHKNRIPVEQGAHLHGLMDETGFLEEGQVLCIITVEGVPTIIVQNQVIVTRSPALHPGDVRLVDAVMVPADSPLMKLHNCVIFSQKGQRDLPSQLSGGDLDGDRYMIIWDQEALPSEVFAPADYPRVPPHELDREVETSDITDFFVEFMETDQLGRIAVLHRVLADQRENGTLDSDCLRLAELHSTAVDFSKTGIKVRV